MKKEVISTTAAPAAVGPYSQAVLTKGELLFISGQVPIDPQTGKIVDGGIEAQATQSCKNLAAILAAKGLDFSDVAKTTVFIAHIEDFPKVNKVYSEFFKEPFPARSCVEVGALPLGALVEIEAIVVA